MNLSHSLTGDQVIQIHFPGKQGATINTNSDENYCIRSNVDLTPRAPWSKVQFIKYETQIHDNEICTYQYLHSIDHDCYFSLVHRYGEDSAEVVFTDYPEELAPLRFLGDGFAPWNLWLHNTLTLHASSVMLDDVLLIFLGFHSAGKSTIANSLVKNRQAQHICDDMLNVHVLDRGIEACPAFWEEIGTSNIFHVSKAHLFVLDDNSLRSNDGEQLFVDDPIMSIAQFVTGLYCSSELFDRGISVISDLLGISDFDRVPARPDEALILDLLWEK